MNGLLNSKTRERRVTHTALRAKYERFILEFSHLWMWYICACYADKCKSHNASRCTHTHTHRYLYCEDTSIWLWTTCGFPGDSFPDASRGRMQTKTSHLCLSLSLSLSLPLAGVLYALTVKHLIITVPESIEQSSETRSTSLWFKLAISCCSQLPI